MSSLDENDLVDTSEGVIRKVKNEYCIFSKEGKSLGCYKTKESATKRLRQIEFFKRNGFVKGDLVAKEASDMVHYESAKAASNEDRLSAIEKHAKGNLHKSTWSNSAEELE
jgi:type II secretory pathway component PulC